jgi:hypothetical protein
MRPLQQAPSVVQVPPKDLQAQVPSSRQEPAQHSPSLVQPAPAATQVHRPLAHAWVQHSSSAPHAAPPALQHASFVHAPEQQDPGPNRHASPIPKHAQRSF